MRRRTEYRVHTAAALVKGGHDIKDEVRAGRARIAHLAHERSEPQGEPSDAQRYRSAIEDALPMIGLFRAWDTSPEQIENVRVILARALDAAGGVR